MSAIEQKCIDIINAEFLRQEYEDIVENAKHALSHGLNGLALAYAISAHKVMQKREQIINRLIFGV
jgi:hypothetical protein